MAGNIKDIKIRIGGDVQKLNAAIRSASKETSALQKELKQTEKLLQFKPGNTELLAQKQQILGSAISQTKDKLDTLKSAQVQLDEQFKKGEISAEQYAEQSRALTREIMSTEQQLVSLERQLGSSENKWRDLGIKMEAAGEKMQKVGDKMSTVGSKLTMGVTAPLAALGGLAAKAAIDFESAFAGVEKTVNATDEQLAVLKQGIRDMAKEIPASASAIAEVGEAAGQLGIKTDNILSFTRTMIDLGEATNLSATDAATSLAKFANITQMSQLDFDRLGSTIVELGNNLATTEADIVALATNLASAGSQVGMSEAQIVSFAAALSSVGMEAQAGGTSMSKAMIEMQLAVETGNESLEKFASVAGMSSQEFQKAFKDDAATAITAFIQGLSTAEKRGMSAIAVLDEMGITETRLRDSLLRAAGASDLFANSIQMGSAAWSENNALTAEAEKRYQTTAAKLQIFKNKAVDLGISFGEMILPSIIKVTDKLSTLLDGFNKLSPATKKVILTLAGIAAAAGPVLMIGGKMVKTIGILTKGIGGFITKLTMTGAPLAAAGSGISGVSTAAAGAGTGVAKFGGSLAALASPAGIAVAAIAGIGIATGLIVKELNERVVPEVDLFGESVSETTEEALGSFLKLSNEGSAQMGYLASSGAEVTAQMATDISTNIATMKEQVIAVLEEQKTEGLASMQELVAGLVGYSEEEKQALIDSAVQGVDGKIKAIEDGETRINEILTGAVEQKRGLNEAEYQEYVAYQNMLKEAGIVALTETQTELNSIRTEMKNQATSITAEQGSEMLQLSAQNRNEMISAAEEEYKTKAEMLQSALVSENETTRQMAMEALLIAEEEKNAKIRIAEEGHQGVLDEVTNMGINVLGTYDTTTGEILSKWQSGNAQLAQMNMARSANFTQTEEGIVKTVSDGTTQTVSSWDKITQSTNKTFPAMSATIGNSLITTKSNFNTLPVSVGGAMSSTESKVSTSFGKVKKTMEADSKSGVTAAGKELNKLPGKVDTATAGIPGKLVNAFKFTPPSIKVPHFSVSGKFNMETGSVPSFGVKWYDKGGIFDKPSIIGVGEKRPEFVGALDDLKAIFKKAMREESAAAGSSSHYIDNTKIIVTVEGDASSVDESRITRAVEKALYKKQKRTSRSRGLATV